MEIGNEAVKGRGYVGWPVYQTGPFFKTGRQGEGAEIFTLARRERKNGKAAAQGQAEELFRIV